jgi:hypothetical protein
VFGGPFGQKVFLGEVEVRVRDSVGGEAFGLWDGGRSDVDAVVLATGLEEEALGDDLGDGEGAEEVGEEGYWSALVVDGDERGVMCTVHGFQVIGI